MQVVERYSWDNNDALEGICIVTDRRYQADYTKYPVILTHGFGGDHMSTMPKDQFLFPPVVSLLDAGFLVLGIDGGGPFNGPSNWGADVPIQRIADAIFYAQLALGSKTGGAMILGSSMGTLSGLSYAARNPTIVKAACFCYPAVDLASIYATGVYTSSINTAYGSAAAYTAALPTHNPIAQVATTKDIPTLLYYSTDDPITFPARVAAYQALTNMTRTVSLGAVGHGDYTRVPGQDVVDFFLPFSRL